MIEVVDAVREFACGDVTASRAELHPEETSIERGGNTDPMTMKKGTDDGVFEGSGDSREQDKAREGGGARTGADDRRRVASVRSRNGDGDGD